MLDPKGISNGEEQYESFERPFMRKKYVQYDFRDADGELFSTVKPTLDECRAAKDEWLKTRKGTEQQ